MTILIANELRKLRTIRGPWLRCSCRTRCWLSSASPVGLRAERT